jgi:glutamate dehydrogenase
VEPFLAERGEQVARLTSFLRSLGREGDPDLAGLTLAVRQLRSVLG